MTIIILVTHLLSGGTERTASYLSDEFVKSGNNVTVLLTTGQIFYDLNPSVNVVKLGIPNKSANLISRVVNYFKRKKMVNKQIKTIKPDVVFCLHYKLIKYLKKNQSYVLISSERNNPKILKKNDLAEKIKLFKRTNGVVFQTKQVFDFYKTYCITNGIVIPNAVGNENVFNIKEEKNKKDCVCAVGRLYPQKNYPLLLEAFAIVSSKHPKLKLEIYGEGIQRDFLLAIIREHQLENRVYLMGLDKNAIFEVARSKCYVLCSNYEGMPNALIEAMAVGAPCVSTDCDFGPRELIKNGVNGLLVPVNDVNMLAIAIEKMISDELFASKCGAEAKKILATNSPSLIAKKYLDYFERF